MRVLGHSEAAVSEERQGHSTEVVESVQKTSYICLTDNNIHKLQEAVTTVRRWHGDSVAFSHGRKKLVMFTAIYAVNEVVWWAVLLRAEVLPIPVKDGQKERCSNSTPATWFTLLATPGTTAPALARSCLGRCTLAGPWPW